LRESPSDAVPALALSLCSQHQAPLEQIETGTAKHLAFECLQTLDMALHRAMTPGQGDTSFDRVVVVAPPFRKPLQRA
jgi:hypothetical protein